MSDPTPDRYTGTLNDAQLHVLRWIVDGCPDGVMDGYNHRITAAALQTRILVRITGRGASWSAAITERGNDYLKNPPAPKPTRRRRRSAPTETPAPRQPSDDATPSADEESPLDERTELKTSRRLSKTEQLIADLIAAGGVLRVPRWREQGAPDYEQRVHAAQRFGKVPEGKRLRIDWVQGGELEIRLEDAPKGTNVATAPVPVPKRIGRVHPVARTFRDQTDRHEVSRVALPRCVRIIHGLAAEVEKRGFTASNVAQSRGAARNDWTPKDGHLTIEIRGHHYGLRISEEKVLLRGPWDAETRRRAEARYALWHSPRPMRNYDSQATGKLTITLDHGYSREGRPSTFADRKTWTLEDKLPDLLRELEIRVAEDDHRDQEAKQRADERQRQWELAMERAKEDFLEAYRAKVLDQEVLAWQRTTSIRRYLAALQETQGDAADENEWMIWIRQYLQRLDPTRARPELPSMPERIPLDELRPFLNGLSPYGPSS